MDARKVDPPRCPRCNHFIPNDDEPGEYPGALSRTDNYTEICSDCGTKEAWEQWRGVNTLQGEGRAWWQKMRGQAWFPGRLKK